MFDVMGGRMIGRRAGHRLKFRMESAPIWRLDAQGIRQGSVWSGFTVGNGL